MKTKVMTHMLRSLVAFLTSIGIATHSSAGVILSAESVSQNTLGTFSSIPANSIDFVSDGSGVPAFLSGITNFQTYMSGNPTHSLFIFSNAWASAEQTTVGFIDFFLGDIYSIEQLALWNQADESQDINSFTVFTSVDSSFSSAINVGSLNAVESMTGQVFDLSDSVGSYVRLQINSNHGSNLTTTLGEIAFDVNPASIPTPATVVLVFMGVATLGWLRRRKT